MTIEKALDFLNHTMGMNQPRGLDRMERLLSALGHPDKSLKFVHVAGTNGKGSTVAFLNSILLEAGYKTGVYTSPGLMRYSERIVVNREEIHNEEISTGVAKIKEAIAMAFSIDEPQPSFFEMTLALALMHFKQRACDIVLLEVGLGGRFDATNVIREAEVSILTTIGLDHMDRLGNTIEEIAFEKAGIIKEHGRLVLYPQVEKARKIILERAQVMSAEVYTVQLEKLNPKAFDDNYQYFDYKNHKDMASSLIGQHQLKNVTTAIEAVEVLKSRGMLINDQALKQGVAKTIWPGRFEKVSVNPRVIVDAAHNQEGVEALIENLKAYYPNSRVRFIFGVMADKTYDDLLIMIKSIAIKVYCLKAMSERAVEAGTLVDHVQSLGMEAVACSSPEQALELAMSECLEDDIICAFGSFYYIGYIRKYFGLY